jgi:hypothetical protein
MDDQTITKLYEIRNDQSKNISIIFLRNFLFYLEYVMMIVKTHCQVIPSHRLFLFK